MKKLTAVKSKAKPKTNGKGKGKGKDDKHIDVAEPEETTDLAGESQQISALTHGIALDIEDPENIDVDMWVNNKEKRSVVYKRVYAAYQKKTRLLCRQMGLSEAEGLARSNSVGRQAVAKWEPLWLANGNHDVD